MKQQLTALAMLLWIYFSRRALGFSTYLFFCRRKIHFNTVKQKKNIHEKLENLRLIRKIQSHLSEVL